MEGIPFRLVISLIIVGVVIYITFYELTIFIELNHKQRMFESVKNVLNTMDSLSSVDEGFSSVQLYVMHGANVTFDNETNQLIVNQTVFETGHNILYDLTVEPGVWKIQVYKGNVSYEYFLSKQPMMVYE
ncbi:MAG: hypothetical protein GOU97_01120 [Nanoarchaeota archaeon]|nr:hypothetical protein [Nanoarchaeota archaeon]